MDLDKLKKYSALIFFVLFLIAGCYTKPYVNLEDVDLRDKYPFSGMWANNVNGGFKRVAHVGAEYVENKLIFEDDGTFILKLYNQSLQGTFEAKYPNVTFWSDSDNLFIGGYELIYDRYEITLIRISGDGIQKYGEDLLEGEWKYSP